MHQSALLASNWKNASVHSGGRCNTPASAQWNVSGKMSTKCFWNACKALSIGLLLMLIGGSMATIGYYADQQSGAGNETRGNMTASGGGGSGVTGGGTGAGTGGSATTAAASNVWVKHDARGFHLNNLSYAGPIVMGVGGFIVVAACVMTFEARDTAAKVAAARGKSSQASTHRQSKRGSPRGESGGGSKQASFRDSEAGGGRRKTSSSQLNKWDYADHRDRGRGDSFAETSSIPRSPVSTDTMSRRALTAAFIQFSKNLQQTSPVRKSPLIGGNSAGPGAMNRCPSAPDLIDGAADLRLHDIPVLGVSPKSSLLMTGHQRGQGIGSRSFAYQQRRDRGSVSPSHANGTALLNPHSLLKRQAMSVDIPDYCSFFSPPRTPQHVSRQGSGHSGSRESIGGGDVSCDNSLRCLESQQNRTGSQASMAMDLHLPNDCPVTLKIKDRTKPERGGGGAPLPPMGKSPSFSRRQLLHRQSQIEHGEIEASLASLSPNFLSHGGGGHSSHSRFHQDSLEMPRSMPHSRQESIVSRLSPRSSFDDSGSFRAYDAPPRDTIAGMANQKYKYSRAKTFDESSVTGVTGSSIKVKQRSSVRNRHRRKSDDRRRGSNPTPEMQVSPRRSPTRSPDVSPRASAISIDRKRSQSVLGSNPEPPATPSGTLGAPQQGQWIAPERSPTAVIDIEPVVEAATAIQSPMQTPIALDTSAQAINKTDHSAKVYVEDSPNLKK